jgi:hypothetical protein
MVPPLKNKRLIQLSMTHFKKAKALARSSD